MRKNNKTRFVFAVIFIIYYPSATEGESLRVLNCIIFFILTCFDFFPLNFFCKKCWVVIPVYFAVRNSSVGLMTPFPLGMLKQ